jgi:uncharacterized membrane protein
LGIPDVVLETNPVYLARMALQFILILWVYSRGIIENNSRKWEF